MRQQPPPPASWGTPPPPRPPTANGLPWYQRWWWAVALVAFLLGAAFAGGSQPEPEPEIRTVTQVSERPVWTPECEEIPNQSERRQCEGIMAGYNRSLQPATTTTVASTTATTRRPRPATTTTRRPRPATTQPPARNCHPSYPDFCIPAPPPDLDCADVSGSDFTVLPPDPHQFDREGDGVGCESYRRPLLALHPIENRMAPDHPDDHPDGPSGSV
jgi:hypothetical protein